MLQISNDEYQQRLTGLRKKIQRAELDVFVVSAFESIYYLTGAGCSAGLAFSSFARSSAIFTVSSR